MILPHLLQIQHSILSRSPSLINDIYNLTFIINLLRVYILYQRLAKVFR